MVKENQRTRLTKQLLKDALMHLMQQKPISKITIKEICETAELNRSTFYLHYTDPYQLLQNIENEVLDLSASYMDKIREESNPTSYLTSFFQYVKSNQQVFSVLLLGTENPEFQTKLIMQTLSYVRDLSVIPDSGIESKYLYIYLMQGSSNLLKEWIRSDFDISAEELAKLSVKLVKNTLLQS
jgi:AcrR family transcriptional regulator